MFSRIRNLIVPATVLVALTWSSVPAEARGPVYRTRAPVYAGARSYGYGYAPYAYFYGNPYAFYGYPYATPAIVGAPNNNPAPFGYPGVSYGSSTYSFGAPGIDFGW